jgi:hypothetical protein
MRSRDLRRYAPVAVIVVLVAAPLAIWAGTSGGGGDDDKRGLIAERGTSIEGTPELILSIAGDVQVQGAATSVRVECTDKDGNVIVNGTQPWPFVDEPGYPYPHVHQIDSPEKIEGARRCRVLGTDTRLEAEVQ